MTDSPLVRLIEDGIEECRQVFADKTTTPEVMAGVVFSVAGRIVTHLAAEPDATRAKQAHFAVMFLLTQCAVRDERLRHDLIRMIRRLPGEATN